MGTTIFTLNNSKYEVKLFLALASKEGGRGGGLCLFKAIQVKEIAIRIVFVD